MGVDQYDSLEFTIRKKDFFLRNLQVFGVFGLVSIRWVGKQCIDGTLLVLGSALCCLDVCC